jgi:rhodanese-related sulfurtransferase
MLRLTNSHSITRGLDAPSRRDGFANVKLAAMEITPCEVSPLQVKDLLDRGAPIRLLDVRETAEYEICRIEGSRLIPMRSIPDHLKDLERELDEGSTVVVFCHHGVRSLSVVEWLRKQGMTNCTSMAGGIDLWSVQVDAAVPRY